MKLPKNYKGRFRQNLYSIFIITRHEYFYNLVSTRMLVILILFAFGTVGSAYGLSYLIISDQQEVLSVDYDLGGAATWSGNNW